MMKLIFKIVYVLLGLVTIASCRKAEVMPAPVGEKIPYQETQLLINNKLSVLPNNTLFNMAWQKSNVDSLLTANDVALKTLFVPSDDAMSQAGWTKETIAAASRLTIDSLIWMHVAFDRTDPDSLQNRKINRLLPTLALIKALAGKQKDLTRFITQNPINNFSLGIYAQAEGTSLMLFGSKYGEISNAVECKDGILYPITKVISTPKQTIYKYLETDGRFSMYLEAIRINDSLYVEAANNYDPGFNGLIVTDLYKNTAEDLISTAEGFALNLFVPTDNAFRNEGFNTVQDLRDYSLRNQPLETQYDENWNPLYPLTALDSLMGLNHISYKVMADRNDLFFYPQIYFSNDFSKGLADFYAFKVIKEYYFFTSYYSKLEFSQDNGTLKIKRQGSLANPISLQQQNAGIRLKNGVINIIDDGLLMP